MSEGDHASKQEAKRRLSDPEGDHELHSALERMREHHPHLWDVLHRVHLAHDADPSKRDEWRRRPWAARRKSGRNNTTKPWAPWR